jgi:hypothetical protein
MRPRSAVLLAVGVLALGSLVVVSPASAQCAMCKTVVNGSAEGRTLATQLNHAILVMLAAPYVVFGSLAAVLFRAPLRARLLSLRRRVLGF